MVTQLAEKDPLHAKSDLEGQTSEPDQPLPEVMHVRQAAIWLGIPESTLYQKAAKGEIPGARRIGKHLLIHRPTVVAWFASGNTRLTPKRGKA